MFKVLGAAVAAVVLSLAGSASAAVIDFEGYSVGASTAAGALNGTPHPLVKAVGTVALDPGGSSNKVLKLTQNAKDDGFIFIVGGPTGQTTEWGSAYVYLADLVSFDVWVPFDTYMNGSPEFAKLTLPGGQWTTYTVTGGRHLDVGNSWYFSIANSPAYIDNLIFANEHIGVVPEPATWAMITIGFGLAGSALRRRQRVAIRVAVNCDRRGNASA